MNYFTKPTASPRLYREEKKVSINHEFCKIFSILLILQNQNPLNRGSTSTEEHASPRPRAAEPSEAQGTARSAQP